MTSALRGRVEQVKQDLKNWLRRLALLKEVEAVWELYVLRYLRSVAIRWLLGDSLWYDTQKSRGKWMAVERFSSYQALAALRAEVSLFLALLYFSQAWSEFSLLASLNRR